MGGKNSAPPPPDYGPLIAASKKQAKLNYRLAKEQFAWAKEQYAHNREITDQVVDSFLDVKKFNFDNAVEDRNRYENVFQPLEDQLAKDALDYASPERKEREVGEAQATVAQSFNAARENAQRNLESYGINPGATRYAALDIGMRTAQAATQAAAGSQAAERVENTGRALRSEAINVGRGYPGQIAGTFNTGLQSGTGAVNSGLATTTLGANMMGTPMQWTGLGNQSLGAAAGMMNMGHQNAIQTFNANQQASSGWGGLLGAGLGLLPMFFDKGGEVENPGAAVPGNASPSRGLVIDDVPAQLTVGEFVLPRDAVSWMGEEKIHKLIMKAREDKQKVSQQSGAIPSVGRAPAQAPTFNSRVPTRALPMQVT